MGSFSETYNDSSFQDNWLNYLKNVVVLRLFSSFYSPESALLWGRDSRGHKFLEKLKKKTSVVGHNLTVLFCFVFI